MKKTIINILRSPILAVILVIIAAIAGMWASASHHESEPVGSEEKPVVSSYIQENTYDSQESTEQTSVSSVTSAVKTTTSYYEDTSETNTTETVTEEPVIQEETAAPETEPVTEEVSAIDVPYGTQTPVTKPPLINGETAPSETTETVEPYQNAEPEEPTENDNETNYNYPHSDEDSATFYNNRITVAGDSIAYGFNIYGLIPYERNLASESVSMWNLDYFYFNGMGLVDAVIYNNPAILYMSMGMNDVNYPTAYDFGERYRNVINSIHANLPDTIIVVAGITPVSYDSEFTSNSVIRDYNSAIKNVVADMNSDHVYYFDAYSVLCDEYQNLRYDCSAGDGIHLQSSCYYEMFNALYNYLDTTPVRSIIEASGR